LRGCQRGLARPAEVRPRCSRPPARSRRSLSRAGRIPQVLFGFTEKQLCIFVLRT
jgi:hypothetical protein